MLVLLRSPSVLEKPLPPGQAERICQHYRQNPNWRLIENAPVMESIWKKANKPGFPRRKIFDTLLTQTLQHHQITELATANIKDFQGLDFNRVWNPVTGKQTTE